MKKYFVCSDVHSFYREWMEAIKNKGFDLNNSEHHIIICGDLFDRGDQSKECFEFINQMLDEGRAVYVRGNHEDLLLQLLNALQGRQHISNHHISNGTIKTIANLLDCKSIYDVLCNTYDSRKFDDLKLQMELLINKAVDFFELGKTVFVHGWVPTTCDENRTMIVDANWRDGGWREARWENGMEMFHFGITPSDVTTVVCGHWHTSFAWSKYKHACSEWDDDAKFDTYIDSKDNSTIVALDACTVYTLTVNCVVFDEEGNIIDE